MLDSIAGLATLNSSSQMSGLGATHCNRQNLERDNGSPARPGWRLGLERELRGNLARCAFRIWQCLPRDLWL